METFKISAVLAAAEQHSLSKAAEAFSYTPSAFSHLVAAFEEELGVRIFERSSAGVTLTKEGEALIPKFKALLKCEKDLRRAAANLAGQTEQKLRICTYSSISRRILSGIIKKLRKDYPQIELSVHVVDNLNDWLKNDGADLFFADEQAFGDLDWIPLTEDPFYVIAPAGFFGQKTAVDLEDLYQFPYISTDDFDLNKHLDLARFKECIHYKSIDDLSIINAVREGIGITILPRMVFEGAAEGVDIIELRPAIKRTIGIRYNKQRIRDLRLTKFIQSLQ